MIIKKFKQILTLILLIISMPCTVLAYSDYIYAGGENIGIEVNSKGVVIIGSYNVGNVSPIQDANLKLGDRIISINDKNINNVDDMVSLINENGSKGNITIGFLRGDKKYTTTLKIIKDNTGIYKTGLYVKDSITGIGTLTFVDPNTKIFGALGHEITLNNTNQLLEVKDGKIFDSKVTSIERSEDGIPGEKNAIYTPDKVNGKVLKNTTKGVFGTYTSDNTNQKLYKVVKPSNIKIGAAKIRTVIQGNKVEEFDINIIKIINNKDVKNILFEVTDNKLLSATNGIVAGMSGSPIIQDDRIVGAVTHVVVDNPIRGYGVFITNMLEEAEK